MKRPAISVLMSAWNGAPWVAQAVESMLTQTEPDFELIVIDDGSTDQTPEVLAGFSDPRVRVERHARAGLTRSLNRALTLARAPLLARLDADDVAMPERLKRQRDFLDAHPEIGLVGTAALEVDASGREVGMVRPPVDDAAVRRALIRENPFAHSSVMMRRALVEQVGGYEESVAVAQDYDLWMRMSRLTRLANLAEPLVLRRLVPGQVSSARDTERLKAEVRVKLRALRSGAYPPWCALFLLKPLLALALPVGPRRLLRRAVTTTRTSRGTIRIS